MQRVFGFVPLEIFLAVAALYLPLVWLGARLMRHRQAFDLQYVIVAWNAVLSLLSGWAAFFVVRDVFIPLVQRDDWLCDHTIFDSMDWSVMYILVFNLTKAIEFGDTVFLVLRKRPLTFLHLFHHVVTMLYCLHASLFSYKSDTTGAVFASLNLVVHFFMYGYWALLPFVPGLRGVGFVITLMQTTQMIVGLGAILVCLWTCPNVWQLNWHGHVFALGMYAVYFWLFFRLASAKLRQLSLAKKEKAARAKKD